MPLPITTVCIAFSYLVCFGFHIAVFALVLMLLAIVNESARILAARDTVQPKPLKSGDTTLIPNRERTSFTAPDE